MLTAVTDAVYGFYPIPLHLHESLEVGGFPRDKRPFQTYHLCSQNWGTLVVLPFAQRLGVPKQAMGIVPHSIKIGYKYYRR